MIRHYTTSYDALIGIVNLERLGYTCVLTGESDVLYWKNDGLYNLSLL